MERPTVLLLGGRHKGEPYTGLLPYMERIKTVIAYGEAGELIEKDLRESVGVVRVNGSFEDVIDKAAEIASPGDAVLLSPACSSFDMFMNYEERGAAFARLAEQQKLG
jgi:UDP-N-acetylmuramoylalanine--D-glutamate ligase